jgi:biopolymer transport protein TolR
MPQPRHRNRRRPMAQINVVPYIDVMLVLLVIFMITAPLLAEGVKVELPSARAKAITEQPAKPLILTIDPTGAYYLSIGGDPSQPVGAETLLARATAVLRRRPDTLVLVRGDAQVPYQKVVTAMALLQSAGAPSVGLLTRSPQTNEP